MSYYTVCQGDCLSSIADEHGLFWESIWQHPNNTELVSERKDPNVLEPGDKLFLPDKTRKQVSGATEQRHRFVKKGTPVVLRLRIMEEPLPEGTEEGANDVSDGSQTDSVTEDPPYEPEQVEDIPRSNAPYTLDVDGRLTQGHTDGDGRIELSIPATAKSARLIIDPGTNKETDIPVQIGHLNPVSKISGVKQRLQNLGFDCGDDDETETPDFGEAVRAFQEKSGLSVTGEADEQTRSALEKAHGS